MQFDVNLSSVIKRLSSVPVFHQVVCIFCLQSTKDKMEMSCGWAHLPLLEENGSVVQNRYRRCLLHSFCPSAFDKHLHWRSMGVLFRTGAVCCTLFVLQPLINMYTGGEWECCSEQAQVLFAAVFLSFSL